MSSVIPTSFELKRMIQDVLTNSYNNKLGHIPSALSWLKMLYQIFKIYDTENNIFIFGKFWGTQSLYAVLRELKIADVKHMSELPFVYNINYETIGDTLGYACGVAMSSEKPVICVLSDACLQSGYVYEAIEFMLHHKLNIKVFIDNNNEGVCDKLENILSIDPLISMLKMYNKIAFLEPDDENFEFIRNTNNSSMFYFYRNIKGDLLPLMQDKKWHYKILDEQTYLDLMSYVDCSKSINCLGVEDHLFG